MLTLSCDPGAGDPGQLRHPGGGGDSEGQQQPGPGPGDQAHQVREPQDLQSGAQQPQLEPAGRGQGENQYSTVQYSTVQYSWSQQGEARVRTSDY